MNIFLCRRYQKEKKKRERERREDRRCNYCRLRFKKHQNAMCRDFSGGAVDKTLRSQCRGPRFDPWSGN